MQRSFALGTLCTVLLVLLSGCASVTTKRPAMLAKSSTNPAISPEQAVEEYDRNRDAAQLEAARSWLEQGQLARSEAALSQLLGRRPEHRAARVLLAQLRIEQGRAAEAIPDVQQLVDEDASDAEATFVLGLLLEQAGQPGAAERFAIAAKLDPDNELYRTTLTAATSTTAMLQPHRSQSRNLWSSADGATNCSQADELTTQLEQLRSAVEQQPHNLHIRYEAALVALRANQPAIAVELLESVCEQYATDLPLQRTLAMAHYRYGSYPVAEQRFRYVLQLDNMDSLAYFSLGCTLTKLGQADAARACFVTAAQLDPRFSVPASTGK